VPQVDGDHDGDPTVTITGAVLTPDGDAVSSGRIEFTLRTRAATDPATGALQRLPGGAGSVVITLGTGGALPAAAHLVPNDVITPSGTYYRARFICRSPDSGIAIEWSEKWQVASSPASVNVGAVPRLDVVAGQALTVTPWYAEANSQAAEDAAYAAGARFVVRLDLETETVATPTFNPAAGTYSGTQTVTISCATAGAAIVYSLDGTNPPTTPYTVPVAVATSATLRARATHAMTDSVV
jgi:hypothetical protein